MHTIEFTDEELRILESALRSFLDDFGHDEMDIIRQVRAILEKLPKRASPPG
jgi:hypothetical protein